MRLINSHWKSLIFLKYIIFDFHKIPKYKKGKFEHREIQFKKGKQEIIASVVLPPNTKKHKRLPVVIIAMGVYPYKKELIEHLLERFSQVGFVAVWPRSKKLKKNKAFFESPETFREAFVEISKLNFVDAKNISFVGFSVGSSIAFVAAADPKISNKVKSFVFFGGYFDALEYFQNLAHKRAQDSIWNPSAKMLKELKTTIKNTKFEKYLKIFSLKKPNLTRHELENLNKYSPAAFVQEFKAPIHIIHDLSDNFVPYHHSNKLYNSLNEKTKKKLLLTNLFNHVLPKRELSITTAISLLKLYKFTFSFLDNY